MSTKRGSPMLSKFTIAPGESTVITSHPSAAATLWIDSGTVHLAGDTDERPLTGGPIPLDHGPVAVVNPGETHAVVYAALAHGAVFMVFCQTCQDTERNPVIASDLSSDQAFDGATDHNAANAGHDAIPKRQLA